MTETGYGHILRGTICQDFSISDDSEGYALIVVCDGHGSQKHFRSDRGSKMAACIFHDIVKEMYSESHEELCELASNGNRRELEFIACHLVRNLIFRWREAVKNDIGSSDCIAQFDEKEIAATDPKILEKYRCGKYDVYSAYGTTFIAACMTGDLCFGIQIGDGDLSAMDNEGRFRRLVPDDPKCSPPPSTTSLCDDDAFGNARVSVCLRADADFPMAIFACSDGVIDSFSDDYARHSVFLRMVHEKSNDPDFEANTRWYLREKLSKEGSRDDVSLAGIVICDLHDSRKELNNEVSASESIAADSLDGTANAEVINELANGSDFDSGDAKDETSANCNGDSNETPVSEVSLNQSTDSADVDVGKNGE